MKTLDYANLISVLDTHDVRAVSGQKLNNKILLTFVRSWNPP